MKVSQPSYLADAGLECSTQSFTPHSFESGEVTKQARYVEVTQPMETFSNKINPTKDDSNKGVSVSKSAEGNQKGVHLESGITLEPQDVAYAAKTACPSAEVVTKSADLVEQETSPAIEKVSSDTADNEGKAPIIPSDSLLIESIQSTVPEFEVSSVPKDHQGEEIDSYSDGHLCTLSENDFNPAVIPTNSNTTSFALHIADDQVHNESQNLSSTSKEGKMKEILEKSLLKKPSQPSVEIKAKKGHHGK